MTPRHIKISAMLFERFATEEQKALRDELVAMNAPRPRSAANLPAGRGATKRAMVYLAKGPATSAEIAAATGIPGGKVSALLAYPMSRGRVVRTILGYSAMGLPQYQYRLSDPTEYP